MVPSAGSSKIVVWNGSLPVSRIETIAVVETRAKGLGVEIVVGDRTIYSKLETGRLPNAKDVIDGLRRVGLTMPLEAKYLGTAPRSEL